MSEGVVLITVGAAVITFLGCPSVFLVDDARTFREHTTHRREDVTLVSCQQGHSKRAPVVLWMVPTDG